MMFFLSYGNDFCWSPTNVCNNVSLKSTTIPQAVFLDLANQSDAKIIKNPKHAVYIHGIEMVVPSQNWILILQNINRLHGCCCWFSFLLTFIREHKPAVPSCAEQPRLAAAPPLPRRSRAHSKFVSPGPVVQVLDPCVTRRKRYIFKIERYPFYPCHLPAGR